MVKKYLIYTLLLFFSFIWINNLGKQKTKSLFESTGEPRRIYESRITIWDQERQIAKIITNSLEETKENLWLIKDITEAIFYRNYEPYVEVDSKSAKYNDLMETLEFEGPFSAKTNDGITAKTMRALWTKKSQLLFFPDSVNLNDHTPPQPFGSLSTVPERQQRNYPAASRCKSDFRQLHAARAGLRQCSR